MLAGLWYFPCIINLPNQCINFFISLQRDQKKIAKRLLKLPKNDFTRKMIDFDKNCLRM